MQGFSQVSYTGRSCEDQEQIHGFLAAERPVD